MLMAAASAATGSGTVVAIGLDIYAVNNFSGPAAEAGASIRKLQSEFKRTMYENLRVARNMYGGLAAAGGMVLRGMNRMYQSFIDFDYIMKGTQIVSQATESQFRALRSEALRLGETTMFYADNIGHSMREMAKAGQPVEDILNNINAAVAGAGATMEDLSTSTRAVIATLAQFQIPSENAMDVMDKLVAATTGAKNTMPQLSEALKYSSADFYALQIPLEHALGMLMTMHNFGIEGSMAGTAMGNALRYLSKAMSDFRTSRQTGAMEIFGFSEKDFLTAKGDFKDMVDVFGTIMQRIREMESVKAQTTMEALFGIRGKRAAFPMAAAHDQTARNIERINNAQGMALDYLNQMMATQKGQYIMMKSAWQTARIAMGEAMEKFFGPMFRTLRGIAQTITWITQQASDAPQWLQLGIKYIGSFLAGLVAVKTIVWAIKAGIAMIGMVTSNTRISLHNMKQSMATNWAILKAKAMGYKGVIDGIVVSKQRLASTMMIMAKGQHMMMAGQVARYGIAPMAMPTFRRKGSMHQYPLYRFSDIKTRKTYHSGTPIPRSMHMDYSRAGQMNYLGVPLLAGQTRAVGIPNQPPSQSGLRAASQLRVSQMRTSPRVSVPPAPVRVSPYQQPPSVLVTQAAAQRTQRQVVPPIVRVSPSQPRVQPQPRSAMGSPLILRTEGHSKTRDLIRYPHYSKDYHESLRPSAQQTHISQPQVHRHTVMPTMVGIHPSQPRATVPGPISPIAAQQSQTLGAPVLLGGAAQQVAKSQQALLGAKGVKAGIISALTRLGIVKALFAIGGFIGKFLMGPWGIAAFILLPPLISRLTGSIRNNTRSVEENTRALPKGDREERKAYDAEFFNAERVFTRLLERAILERKIESGEIKPSKKTEVVFNVDGKHMFRSTLDDRMAKQLFNMGLD